MKELSLEQRKSNYFDDIRAELIKRGIPQQDVMKVISKTGFMSALNDFPEEQLHYSINDAVDEILVVAAMN